MTEELAERVLANDIDRLICEAGLKEVKEHLIASAYITELLGD